MDSSNKNYLVDKELGRKQMAIRSSFNFVHFANEQLQYIIHIYVGNWRLQSKSKVPN